MTLSIEQFVYFFESLVSFAWLPVIIWTLFAGGVLMVLRAFPRMHPQYHYHIRLALILGLPFGLLTSWLADYAASHFSEPAALTFISVTSPIEVGISTAPAATLSAFDYLLLVVGFLLITGLVWYSGSRFIQWFRLQYLRQSLELTPIENHHLISAKNKQFASETGKQTYIAASGQNYIPVTFGVMKPVILVPESLSNSPQKLNLAVRHELTHIQQRDFGTHLFITAIQSVFWFHPLVHMLSNQIVEYREMRCDSLIIADSSVSRKEYASLLFELLPMPNLNQKISVNMAQNSSNLKERISRITSQSAGQVCPYRSSLTILATLLIALTIGMACTDMQTQAVFDEEELDLMTDVDRTGERGYHQILIFMGEDGQTERHEGAIGKLSDLRPEYIKSINVLKGEAAIEKYGERARYGVVEVRTEQDPESYNTALNALGMEPELMPETSAGSDSEEDFFVVVEEMPELIGGLASVQSKIQYPEMARRAGIEGRVYVQFIVNENGDVEDPKVIRGIGGGADEAALDAVRQAKFKPGVQRGRPVKVQYSLPVVFRLNNSDSQATISSEEPTPSPKPMSVNISISEESNVISGAVTNPTNNEILSGANVTIEGTSIGTVTDQNGNFSLDYSGVESPVVIISYIGYTSSSIDIGEVLSKGQR